MSSPKEKGTLQDSQGAFTVEDTGLEPVTFWLPERISTYLNRDNTL
jgi:hypothetical protein